ncbi:uncharacterized protein LOC135366198 [Ornithodoros turicata]|uniref:uncharacterized protein LOC135366198 n=1 Tax=Ornithodoros turicata TaxID=34597 RepID=UPI003139186B
MRQKKKQHQGNMEHGKKELSPQKRSTPKRSHHRRKAPTAKERSIPIKSPQDQSPETGAQSSSAQLSPAQLGSAQISPDQNHDAKNPAADEDDSANQMANRSQEKLNGAEVKKGPTSIASMSGESQMESPISRAVTSEPLHNPDMGKPVSTSHVFRSKESSFWQLLSQDGTSPPKALQQGAREQTDRGEARTPFKDNTWYRTLAVELGFAVVTLVSVVAVILYFLYGRSESSATTVTEPAGFQCNSPKCKRTKREIDHLLNTNVHPCDDFYTYVCSKWSNSSSGRPSGFVKDTLDDYSSALIKALRSHESAKPDKYGGHVMAKLSNVCYGYMINGTDTVIEAVDEIVELTDISKLLNVQHTHDIFIFLVELYLRKNIKAVFVVEYSQDESRQLLLFAPGESITSKVCEGLAEPDLHAMKKMLEELLKHPRINSPSSIDTILSIDRKIDQYLGSPSPVEKATLPEVAKVIPFKTPELLDVINRNVPPDWKINEHSVVQVEGMRSFENIYSLLRNYSLREQALYFTANLVSELLRYTVFRNYTDDNPAVTAFLCLRATRIALTNTWQFVVAKKAGTAGGSRTTMDLAKAVKRIIMDERVLEKFDSKLRSRGKDILNKVTLITYGGEGLKRLSRYTDYSSWNLDDALFSVYVQAGAMERVQLSRSIRRSRQKVASRNQLFSRLQFILSDAVLTIPTAYQRPPLLYFEQEGEMPLYINYATLGTWIAKEMSRAILQPFRGSDQSVLQKSLSCMKSVGRAQGLNMEDAIGADPWESEVVLWYFAFRFVYEGLMRLLTNAGESPSGNIWNEVQRYFFIRFCMMACTSGDDDNVKEPPKHFRKFCMVPAISNADFVAHFHCSGRKDFIFDGCASGRQ